MAGVLHFLAEPYHVDLWYLSNQSEQSDEFGVPRQAPLPSPCWALPVADAPQFRQSSHELHTVFHFDNNRLS